MKMIIAALLIIAASIEIVTAATTAVCMFKSTSKKGTTFVGYIMMVYASVVSIYALGYLFSSLFK